MTDPAQPRRGPTTEEKLRAAWVTEPPKLTGKIQVVDYDPDWPHLFEREAGRIRDVLGERVVQLEHVGSTSVPGLAAKPIIDVLLVVPDSSDEPAYVPDLEAAGYRLVIREPDWFEHRCLKGPDTNVNLHVYPPTCPEIERYLLFRDRLRSHPEERAHYQRVKRELAERDWTYVQEYADAKTEVVEGIIARARGGPRAPTALLGVFTTPSRRRGSIGNDRIHAVNQEDAMRRTMVVGAAILAVLAVIGIGIAAFNAGIDEGISRELAHSGDAGQTVRIVGRGWGYGYGRGFGFPFGLILFPLLIIGIVLLVRGAFWRGRWGGPRWGDPGYRGPGGPGGPGYGYGAWGGPAGFDEYHRRLHEEPPPPPAAPGDTPGGGGTRETPTDPGTV